MTKIDEKSVKRFLRFRLKITLTSCAHSQRIIIDTKSIILLLSIKTKLRIYMFQGNQKNRTLYTQLQTKKYPDRIFELIKNYNRNL